MGRCGRHSSQHPDRNQRFVETTPITRPSARITRWRIDQEHYSVFPSRSFFKGAFFKFYKFVYSTSKLIEYFPQPEDPYVAYDHKMYDISFMIPLMSHLLAPESRVSVQKFTRTGALALIVCALASEAEDTRMAAYHCLQRFRAHLFGYEDFPHFSVLHFPFRN